MLEDSPQDRSLDKKVQVLLEDSPQDMSLDRKSTGIASGQPSGQVSRQEKHRYCEPKGTM
jgi:hypothetical protein